MFHYGVILLGLFFSPLFGMVPKGNQLEFGPTRKVYNNSIIQAEQKEPVKSTVNTSTKPCVFCDKEMLAGNFILHEDHERGVRQMMNKFPYMDFDQGPQILIMPLSHKEHPKDFSFKELINQVDTVQQLSAQLYEDAYTQEYFHNWGAISGQSVPHWHSQFKNFEMPPMSLPERTESVKNCRIGPIEEAFKRMQIVMQSRKDIKLAPQKEVSDSECNCCLIKNGQEDDKKNFVIARFEHNYVCISHYPCLPGELSIIPNNHVAAIKDLSQEALRENMVLAMALLPIMKDYADVYIRECGGGNTYTKSMGKKASDEQK